MNDVVPTTQKNSNLSTQSLAPTKTPKSIFITVKDPKRMKVKSKKPELQNQYMMIYIYTCMNINTYIKMKVLNILIIIILCIYNYIYIYLIISIYIIIYIRIFFLRSCFCSSLGCLNQWNECGAKMLPERKRSDLKVIG